MTILLFVIFIVLFLNQMLEPQEPPRTDGDEYGYDNGYKESEGGCLHAIDEVHTEKRGYERRKHEDDTHGGKRTHHGIHVIIDDASIGLHRGIKDFRIDTRRLSRLTHLDVYVLDEVSIKFINLQFELQFEQKRLITTD